MSTSDELDAEYRDFVRQLHPQTIAIVAETDRYWLRGLFREVTKYSVEILDRDVDEEERKRAWDRCMEIQDHFQNHVEPQINILAYGHPDPDVRRAANVVAGRLGAVIHYYDPIKAKRKDGLEATTATQLAHQGMKELRRVAYHAPFRVERPTPDYDGIGVVEDLPSKLTDVPQREY